MDHAWTRPVHGSCVGCHVGADGGAVGGPQVEQEQLVEVGAACTWDSSRDNSDLDAIQVGAAGQREVGQRREPEVEAEPPKHLSLGGREALRAWVMASSWSRDRTSAKVGRGRIIGIKATCLSNCSPRLTRRALMSVRSSTGSPSSRNSSPIALIFWHRTVTEASP